MPPVEPESVLEAIRMAVASLDASIDPRQVVPEAELSDVGLDSLAAVELVGLLEERFDVALSEEKLFQATRVGDLLELVCGAAPPARTADLGRR